MTNPSNEPKPATERKPLQTFGLHVVFLTLLFWVLPSLDAAYGFSFKSAGNALFGRLGSDLRVDYRWIPPNQRTVNGEIEMAGFVTGYADAAWESSYSVRDRGYEPSAVLLALILATPASRRRHVAGAVIGTLALNVFYLVQSGVLAVCLFATVEPLMLPLGGMLSAALPVVEALFRSPLIRYAAVFAVWAVVATPARSLDASTARKRLGALLRRGRSS
jgi:hypothetical protein